MTLTGSVGNSNAPVLSKQHQQPILLLLVLFLNIFLFLFCFSIACIATHTVRRPRFPPDCLSPTWTSSSSSSSSSSSATRFTAHLWTFTLCSIKTPKQFDTLFTRFRFRSFNQTQFLQLPAFNLIHVNSIASISSRSVVLFTLQDLFRRYKAQDQKLVAFGCSLT